MTFFLKDIPKRLKMVRIASGYRTAREFVRAHDIPVSTYSQHERGERTLTLENVAYYASLLNIDPSWLITGNGSPCAGFNDKELEVKILLAQEEMIKNGEREVVAVPIISVEHHYSMINSIVFGKTLEQLVPLLRLIPDSKVSDAVNFCFEVYNRIVATNAEGNDKIDLIKLCFESFIKGLGIRNTEDFLKNNAMVG